MVEQSLHNSKKKILFYRERDPYGFMSNFYKAPIEMDGKIWPTTEHYFQAMKFPTLPDYQEAIRKEKECSKIKKMGQNPDGFREDWSAVKDQVMKDCLLAKFRQHPQLREELLMTGESYLVEHTRNDTYWADGGDEGSGVKGKNMLGKLLGEVRTELRREALEGAGAQ
ncbi:hypothetical protein FGO68_gene17640 [Halteria grandinella]|uniref:NADAR domain-containing protein n=1 Tax=Halteria grandinella TaxID=5974 RepID=A0A8J8NH43_HALGN|nr:hypothetical protein FGO68_gene17640 [Halteria grandinella]